MPCSQNSALGIVAGVFIILILAVCLWPKCDTQDKPPVQLTKEKSVVNLASAPLPDKYKGFFDSGLPEYMRKMSTREMTEEYKKYGTYATGAGYALLSPLQAQQAIAETQEDGKTSVGTEFRGEEEAEFDASMGYNVQAVGETRYLRVKHPTTGKSCKYDTMKKKYSDCKAVQLNKQ